MTTNAGNNMNNGTANANAKTAANSHLLRPDQAFIAQLVPPRSRVLEVGCAEGNLMGHLRAHLQAQCSGLEVNPQGVRSCLERGFSVVQGDADTDLVSYPDDRFDVVIVSQTLQHLQCPGEVLRQLLRIGRSAIVSFANFGYWRAGMSLMLRGKVPQIGPQPSAWQEIHGARPFTLRDFTEFCHTQGYTVVQQRLLDSHGRTLPAWLTRNSQLRVWLCFSAVVKIQRKHHTEPPHSSSSPS